MTLLFMHPKSHRLNRFPVYLHPGLIEGGMSHRDAVAQMYLGMSLVLVVPYTLKPL